MDLHWSIKYIGLPWQATAEGPDAWHCWSFFRHNQKTYYGIDVPNVKNPECYRTISRQFMGHPELTNWQKVSQPLDGDGVLLTMANKPLHVGIWLSADGGGVLHCSQESGVVFQDLPALTLNSWKIYNFYRHRSRL